MKLSHLVLSFIALFLLENTTSAQIREEFLPKSFTYASAVFLTPASYSFVFDAVTAAGLDRSDAKLGHMPRFARMVAADLSMANAGTWTSLPDGSRVWRLRISSVGALGLIPCYDDFYIPSGATLHVFTEDKEEVLGAFTSLNNPASGAYNTGLIRSDACIIEYYEPAAVAGKGHLHINEIGYAYRMVPGRKASRDYGDSDPCEVNLPCPEGRLFQDQKDAAVRILVKLGASAGWCSGTLMNNTSHDCIPYILSADHCYQDGDNNNVAATTADLNQWIFYFNYESPTCANPSSEGNLGSHFLVGCSFKAASLDNGGDNGSDFVLVRTNTSVPLSFHPYYAGWNNANSAAHAGVSIHHPAGDIKKISTYATTLASARWGNVVPNTHWEVAWARTVTALAVTEPGSSGSALYDFSKRVIGTLTGGASSCTMTGQHDYYGKLSYDWTTNGLGNNQRLQPWLDPGSTGASFIDGQYAPCIPSLNFDAAVSAIQQSGPVCGQNQSITATLTNYGSQQLVEDSLTFTVDGGTPQTLYWSGLIDPLMSEQVSLPLDFYPIGTHTVTVVSSAPNSQADANPSNDAKTATFVVNPNSVHYTFTLQTSDRGSSVSWQLLDANNMIAYAGGPYTNTDQTIVQSWCLPEGCYTFTIFNSAGLGLKGITADGSYDISDNSGNSVASLRSLTFGVQEVTTGLCSTAILGINDADATLAAINVYPNPSSGIITISNATDVTGVTVTDALGRLITSSAMKNEATRQIDLATQQSGVYFVRLTTVVGSVTRKVILSKAN